jgi:hypothetical protein
MFLIVNSSRYTFLVLDIKYNLASKEGAVEFVNSTVKTIRLINRYFVSLHCEKGISRRNFNVRSCFHRPIVRSSF